MCSMGSSRKLIEINITCNRADSQTTLKCRQNGAFRTTYTCFPMHDTKNAFWDSLGEHAECAMGSTAMFVLVIYVISN